MKEFNRCNHAEIDAKYTYVKSSAQDAPVEKRVYSWVCKECGERGTEND
jgi:hypothetical protein